MRRRTTLSFALILGLLAGVSTAPTLFAKQDQQYQEVKQDWRSSFSRDITIRPSVQKDSGEMGGSYRPLRSPSGTAHTSLSAPTWGRWWSRCKAAPSHFAFKAKSWSIHRTKTSRSSRQFRRFRLAVTRMTITLVVASIKLPPQTIPSRIVRV